MAGANVCKPSLAVISVSRSLKFNLNALEEDIDAETSRDDLLDMFYPIKLATDFLCDVAVESFKFGARTISLSTSGRRALWLKAWMADLASKNKLISKPLEPGKLFGSTLDNLLESLVAGKGKTLPQDKSKVQKKVIFFIPQPEDSPHSLLGLEDLSETEKTEISSVTGLSSPRFHQRT